MELCIDRPGAPPPDSRPTSAATRQWNARLEIGIAMRGGVSVAVHRRHTGPLRLQKPLYPEGPGVAHLLVIHPPAGIAGGDRLEIDIDVGNAAQALVTTPGATKWYRSGGSRAHQDVALAVADGACLEWLPQESIVFDGADMDASTTIACERGARCIGWDIVVLGRGASGERFERGAVRQNLSLSCDGLILWRERARLVGGDPLLGSPVGWNGHSVAGVFWAWGSAMPEPDLERCRATTMARPDAGITVLGDGLVVARALSDSVESIRELFHELWTIIRPSIASRCATSPRIWAT
jgi:urease accessory protein